MSLRPIVRILVPSGLLAVLGLLGTRPARRPGGRAALDGADRDEPAARSALPV